MRHKHDQRGSVAMEFALVVALMLAPFAMIVTEGGRFTNQARVTADAAAAVALAIGSDPGPVSNTSALTAMAQDIAGATASVATPVSTCHCPEAVQANGPNAASVTCGSAVCTGGGTPYRYTKVTVTLPYSPIFPIHLPAPSQLTQSASVRTG